VAIAVAAIIPILRHHGGFARPGAAEFAKDFSPIFALALPAILTQLATPVGQAYVTRAMAEFGEEAVAGMAVIARLTPVAFGTIFALSGAVGPIIGQNYGAGDFARVRRAYRDGLLFTALVVVAVAVILFFLRGPIGALFQTEGVALALLHLFCGPLALAWFFNGMIFVSNASFNNLGHPYYSTWINWGRHTLGTVPFVILCAGWFGAAGVLIGQAVGGVIFGLLSGWLALRVMGRKEAPSEPTPFQRQARLLQLFQHRR
jgi:Na+-driven multidrug efflux pump